MQTTCLLLAGDDDNDHAVYDGGDRIMDVYRSAFALNALLISIKRYPVEYMCIG